MNRLFSKSEDLIAIQLIFYLLYYSNISYDQYGESLPTELLIHMCPVSLSNLTSDFFDDIYNLSFVFQIINV